MGAFTTVWIGQVVSLIGSGLTQFALGIWVYQRTGSATQFALISLAAILPAVLVAPMAGVFVDRWERRRTMMASDTITAVGTLSIAGILLWGELHVWHILALVMGGAVAGSFQQPAYQAATSLLVPKALLGKAAGMVQLGEPLSTILAPVLAGALIGFIGLAGIVGIDFLTFLAAVGTLALVRFPAPPKNAEGGATRPSMRGEMAEGWRFISSRRGLVVLLVFFCVLNFVFSFSNALFLPYILSLSDEKTLGVIMSTAGVGGLVGGVVASVWGGPKRRTLAVFGFGAAIGIVMLVVGLSRTPLAVGAPLCIRARTC